MPDIDVLAAAEAAPPSEKVIVPGLDVPMSLPKEIDVPQLKLELSSTSLKMVPEIAIKENNEASQPGIEQEGNVGAALVSPTAWHKKILEIVPSFVPNHVRAYYTRTKEQMPTEPLSEERFGAVVMADVSGYSTLASKLGERGPVGAELLSRTMNGYLQKVVEIVVAHGGDIIKFAGDAVVFCWRTADEDNAVRGEYVLQACECCLELLKKLANYAIEIPDCEIKSLNIHLGVGAGPMFDVHVGGPPGRWEHFIAGESINQLAIVLDLAKPGQLAVSHMALKYLSRIIDVASLELGSYDKRCIILNALEKKKRIHPPIPLEYEPIDDDKRPERCEIYRQYISNSGMYRITAGNAETLLLNEFRRITTIFIKIKSITFKKETCLEHSQGAMDVLQRALVKYEGTLRQFIVDDKGAVILSYFGLPPFAHENDPTIALRACLEIRNGMHEIFDHDFAIGVATGFVYVGLVGSVTTRADYTVVGDSVNMAARLMCNAAAKGDVLCDEETYNHAKNDFEFNDTLGRIKVKGKVNPIAIFKPLKSVQGKVAVIEAAMQNTDILPPIARQAEKEKIVSSLNQIADHVKRCLYLEGEGGQGLFQLAKYTYDKSVSDGHYSKIINASGSELERTTPFWIYRSVLVQVLTLLDGENGSNSAPNPKQPSLSPSAQAMGEITGRRRASVVFSEAPSLSAPTNTLTLGALTSQGSRRVSNIRLNAESIFELNKQLLDKLTRAGLDGGSANVLKSMLQSMNRSSIHSLQGSLVSLVEGDSQQATQTNKTRRQMEVIVKLLSIVSESKGVLLLLQDCQWMDAASWELTQIITQQCSHVDVVITSRPPSEITCIQHAKEFIYGLRDSEKTTVVTLHNLSLDEVRSLISFSFDSTGSAVVNKQLVEKVYKRTAGNYLFTQQVLVALSESKALVMQDGALTVSPADETKLDSIMPSDIKSAIMSQVDKLNQQFQLFLKVAAVVGITFDVEVVLEHCKFEDMLLDELLEQLPQWDVYGYLASCNEDNSSSESTFCFVSSIVRDCIYGSTLFSYREELHIQVAKYYEANVNDSNAAVLMPSVFNHYCKTDLDEEKIKVAERICKYFLDHKQLTATIEYYRAMICLAKKSKKLQNSEHCTRLTRCLWHRQFADGLIARGEHQAALDTLVEALEVLEVPLEPLNPRSAFQQFLSRLFASCLGESRALQEGTNADSAEHAQILTALMSVAMHVGKEDIILQVTHHSLKYAETFAQPKFDAMLGYCSLRVHTVADAKRFIGRAETTWKTVDKASQLEASECLMLAYFALGNWKSFQQHADFVLGDSEATHEIFSWSIGMRAMVSLTTGQLGECSKLANDIATRATTTQLPLLAVQSRLLKLNLSMLMDMQGKAIPGLQDLVSFTQEAGLAVEMLPPTWQLFFISLQFELHVRQGLVDDAEERLSSCVNIMSQLQAIHYGILGPLFHVSQVVLILIESSKVPLQDKVAQLARQATTEALRILKAQRHFALASVCTRLFETANMLLDGRHSQAVAHLKQGIKKCNDEMPLNLLEASMHKHVVMIAKSNGLSEDVSTNVERAKSLFKAMGADSEAESLTL